MALNTPSKQIANRYGILAPLGQGGMGAVYRAVDRLTGHQVALKQVLTEATALEHNSSIASPGNDPLLSLAHEFRTLSSLRHPNIISVLDYGFHVSADDFDTPASPFFTMNLIESPVNIVEGARDKTREEQIDLIIQMLQALAYLHRRGIIHRDLKPGNVLEKDGLVYVLDFGLAVRRDDQSRETVGTLTYIAPEVLRGAHATERADLYAVGLIAAEILGGVHPYQSDTINELIQSVLYDPVDLSAVDVGVEIKNVLLRLLAKNPEERYANVDEVMRALCNAVGIPLPEESISIRESFIQAAEFVGRDLEFDLLNNALERIVTAVKNDSPEVEGSAWLIGGESGVGKSRLMEEIRTQALVKGVLVLRGQAVTEGGLPYQIWRQAIRRLILTVDVSDEEADILRSIVPDIELLIGRDLPAASVEANATNERLTLIIEELFSRASQQQPILILLEDLQWATESLTLMKQLTRLSKNSPIMITGNYRNDEAPHIPQDHPDMQLVQLDRLSQREIAQLSASILGEAGERPHVVNLLQQESEGNVFFLVEVVRALAEDAGRLSDIGSITLPSQVFAGGVQRIVSNRLSQIPQWARHMVRVAAVAGRRIDPSVIRYLDPELDFDTWVTVVVNAAVFDMQEEEARFAHDKLREGVLANIDDETLKAMNRQVAEAIETIYADSLDEFSQILYQHWKAAGNLAKQCHYGYITAEYAQEISQYQAATAIVSELMAIKAYEQVENPQQMFADLNLLMGRILYGTSDYELARPYQATAMGIYREINYEYGLAEGLALIGEIEFRQGNYSEARASIEESMALYQRLGMYDKLGYAHMNMGVIESKTGNNLAANEEFRQCYELAKQYAGKIAIARALNNYALSFDLLGKLKRARELYEESLAIRREVKDQRGIAFSLYNLGALDEIEGDVDSARARMEESLMIFREIGQRYATANALGGLGNLEIQAGNYDIAHQYLQESLHMRREMNTRDGIVNSLGSLSQLDIALGHYEVARTHLDEAIQIALSMDAKPFILNTLYNFADLHRAQGKIENALKLYIYIRNEWQKMLSPTDKVDKRISPIREEMDAAQFATLEQIGMAMSRDEALALIGD